MKSLFVITYTKGLSTIVGLYKKLAVQGAQPTAVFITSKPAMNMWGDGEMWVGGNAQK